MQGVMLIRRRRRRCGGIIGRRRRWGWSGSGSGGEGKKEGESLGLGLGVWFSGSAVLLMLCCRDECCRSLEDFFSGLLCASSA